MDSRTPTAVPSRDEVLSYLGDRVPEKYAAQLDGWAEVLTGLPWRYMEPVVTIAVNTGNHAAVALGMAATYSTDQQFVTAATAQLSRVDERMSASAPTSVKPPAVVRLQRRQAKLAARIEDLPDGEDRARLQRDHDELSLQIGREMGRHDAQAVAAARATRQGNRSMRRRGRSS